jgi:hypothetical protein
MSYSSTILADSPVAYWRLGESPGTSGSGSVLDASGNGYHATPTSVTFGTAGAITDADTAVTCNGTSSVIVTPFDVTGNLGGTNRLTVELWAKSRITQVHSPLGNNDKAVSGTDQASVDFFDNSGQFWVRMKIGGTDRTASGGTWTAGVWYHVAATYDGSNVSLYKNGVLVNAVAATGTIYDSQVPLTIGRRGNYPTSTGGPWWYDGAIDEVASYSAALSSTQLLAHYNAGIATGIHFRRTMGNRSGSRCMQ